jgi:peptide/nickel transport system permease protein
MLRYLVNRLLGVFAVLLIVATIVFVVIRVMPGDPAVLMLGPDAAESEVQALRDRLGLNRSIAVQYATFLGDLARGDLGQSIFLHKPVLAAIGDRAQPTLLLAFLAVIIASAIALPIGILAAVWRGSVFDQVVLGGAMFAASIPNFWLGLLLIQFLAVYLGWFPVSGYGPPDAGFFDRLHHLVLPALAIGVINSALIARFTRAAVLEVLNDDYVRTARAKGLAESKVILKHVLRNAMIPILTIIGLTTGVLISGAVIVETVFGIPGIGNLVVSAVLRRDYPVIQGALLVSTFAYVFVNMLIDLLYLLVDPRVRY